MNGEYHSFYLDVKLRTFDTPLSCQPGIRLTSDQKKTLSWLFVHTVLCIFIVGTTIIYIFCQPFYEISVDRVKKPVISERTTFRKHESIALLKVEWIHCKSCKNVRHYKNFLKHFIQVIHSKSPHLMMNN